MVINFHFLFEYHHELTDFKDSVFQSTAIIILFDAQAVTTLVGPSLSSWVLCSCNLTSLIFKSFLASWYKTSHFQFYLPCSRPKICYFSIQQRMVFRN